MLRQYILLANSLGKNNIHEGYARTSRGNEKSFFFFQFPNGVHKNGPRFLAERKDEHRKKTNNLIATACDVYFYSDRVTRTRRQGDTVSFLHSLWCAIHTLKCYDSYNNISDIQRLGKIQYACISI